MMHTGGIPFYLAVLLVGFTLLIWLIAVVASYLDETPADFEVT
ncbi:MAG: hypothetical protein OJF47_000607 [Nitrospira sp.]|jgi:hypothetical protein|nr:MAG: hypothetical protein OJF47_000607 [Nitrospira sp.]